MSISLVIATSDMMMYAVTATADEQDHGHGELNVVADQTEVHIKFHVPALNLVGFEHSPETPEQKDAIAAAVEQLQQANTLFTVD